MKRIRAVGSTRKKFREVRGRDPIMRPSTIRLKHGTFAEYERVRLSEQGYVAHMDNLLRSGKATDQVTTEETDKWLSRWKTSTTPGLRSRLKNWWTTIRK